MVEGARLESVYRSKAYRGFESLPLRITTLKPNEYDFILVFLLHAKPPETLRDNGFQSVKGISTPFFIFMVSVSIRIVSHEGIQSKLYLFFNNGKKLNF